MKLQTLIVKANKTYELGLDQEGINNLLSRLRMAGHSPTVAPNRMSATLDAILAKADDVTAKPHRRGGTETTAAVYASLKVEATPDLGESCPRCKQGLRTVKLVGGRSASYCQGCHIALPMKAE